MWKISVKCPSCKSWFTAEARTPRVYATIMSEVYSFGKKHQLICDHHFHHKELLAVEEPDDDDILDEEDILDLD